MACHLLHAPWNPSPARKSRKANVSKGSAIHAIRQPLQAAPYPVTVTARAMVLSRREGVDWRAGAHGMLENARVGQSWGAGKEWQRLILES